jgi:hypothetical protein
MTLRCVPRSGVWFGMASALFAFPSGVWAIGGSVPIQ